MYKARDCTVHTHSRPIHPLGGAQTNCLLLRHIYNVTKENFPALPHVLPHLILLDKQTDKQSNKLTHFCLTWPQSDQIETHQLCLFQCLSNKRYQGNVVLEILFCYIVLKAQSLSVHNLFYPLFFIHCYFMSY